MQSEYDIRYPMAQQSMALNLPVMTVCCLLFGVQCSPVEFLRSFISEGY